MKLDKTKLDRVLKSPDNIGALLFYGPDEGLAHEYAGLAQKAVLGSAGDDPFRLAELTPDDLKGDGARLADELNAFYALRDGSDKVVMAEHSVVTTGYDEFDDPLNDISAYEDTIRRGTLQLAEQIRTRVAVFMTAGTAAPNVPAPPAAPGSPPPQEPAGSWAYP